MKTLSILIVATGLLGATVPTNPQWEEWGLAGVVIGFVLYRDFKREDHMSSRLKEQEEFVNKKLIELVDRNTAAIEKLCQRPCMFSQNESRLIKLLENLENG